MTSSCPTLTNSSLPSAAAPAASFSAAHYVINAAQTDIIRPMNTTLAIGQKWPARHPDWIQLYSLPTPNGVKASIMLEETGLPYEPHLVMFETNEQNSAEFLSLNPNNKIPAIIDPNGPGGVPLPLFESG